MQQVRQLTKFFTPTHYALSLALQRTARTFSGTVTLTGTLLQESTELWLHAKELQLSNATINNEVAEIIQGTDDEAGFKLQNPLAPGEYTVTIDFSGTITDTMHGLYPSYFKLDGQDDELLSTQFESHHAREVFPCIDEPAAKATFAITLTTEKNVTVLGNTPVMTQEEKGNLLVTSFEETPKMSTYLLAWAIGSMDYKEATTKDGVIVRTYATPGNAAKTQFALDTAVKTLEIYNDYFGSPYPLPKCDMIALPDFSSGAMENWGLITYRESALFVEATSSTATRQRVAEVVAHELAHQWFGNLVTMQWWNNLWLNESFATWMSYYAQDQLFPEWQIWTQFYNDETSYALDRDALKSIQSVQQEVHHPDEIRTLFDGAIVYAKGANLVHMAHAYIGDEAFKTGLQAYMKRHAYGNTQAEDLWQAWGEASGKDITSFMTPWITQPGHPMVTVTIEENTVQLQQTRFLSNPEETTEPTLWPIPLLAPDALKEELFTQETATLQLLSTESPLLLNQGRTGFYVPHYTPEHLTALGERIKAGQMPLTDRLALLNEAYDLAKAGQQPILQLLQLLANYDKEDTEPVWNAISSAIGALKMIIEEDESLKPALKAFTLALAQSQYERLGWTRIEGEPYFDELLRPIILSLMSYSEDQTIIATALEMFDEATKPEDLLGDIRAIIFSIAARNGTNAHFAKLLEWRKQEQTPEVRNQLSAGLCSTRNQDNVVTLIALLKSEYVKLQDVFIWVAYLSRNTSTRQQMWQWVQDEWAWITEMFESDMHYSSFPHYIAAAFGSQAELESFKQFFEPKLGIIALTREIKQGIENIESRKQWRERDYPAVAEYLKDLPA